MNLLGVNPIEEFVFTNKEKFVNAGFMCSKCEQEDKNTCHITRMLATTFTESCIAVGYSLEEVEKFLDDIKGTKADEHLDKCHKFLEIKSKENEKIERSKHLN